MKYIEVRAMIRSGDLLAFTHRSWRTWNDWKIQLVRFFTQSEYSHVAVAWVVGGRVFVLEAVRPLVRIYPLSKSGDFYWLPTAEHWSPAAEEFALAHVGEPYSQLKAMAAFFGPVRHDGTWECAQYVYEVLKLAGVDLGDKATPTEIVRCAQLQGALCQLISNQGDSDAEV